LNNSYITQQSKMMHPTSFNRLKVHKQRYIFWDTISTRNSACTSILTRDQWRNQDFSSSGQTSLVSKKIDGQNGR